VAAHPVAGLSPSLLLSAGAAVHGPVAFGEEVPAAEGTPFPAVDTAQDLRTQLPVSWEDGGAEVFADQRGGNELRTGAGVAVVQLAHRRRMSFLARRNWLSFMRCSSLMTKLQLIVRPLPIVLQNDRDIIGLAGFLGPAAGELYPARVQQDLPFSQGQGREVGSRGASGGNNGVAVRDFPAVADLGGQHLPRYVQAAVQLHSVERLRNTKLQKRKKRKSTTQKKLEELDGEIESSNIFLKALQKIKQFIQAYLPFAPLIEEFANHVERGTDIEAGIPKGTDTAGNQAKKPHRHNRAVGAECGSCRKAGTAYGGKNESEFIRTNQL